jgi:DNA-binding NarL/FixJ family response regulator
MNTDAITIVVADDEWPWRESVCAVLGRRDDIQIVGQADSCETCLELVQQTSPAVALVDLRMPVMGGIELVSQIRATCPGTAALVFTVEQDPNQIRAAVEAGAAGFLLKSEVADPNRLLEAIRLAALGGAVLAASQGASVLYEFAQRQPTDPAAAFGLTRREKEVLRLLADGLSNRGIAERLVIAEQSAKNHVSSLMQKLDATNRTHAVAVARQQGLL